MADERFADLHAIVLAGGSGTRLWPASRANFPKHLVRLIDDRSLLQHTLHRLLAFVPPTRILTVGLTTQAELLRSELAAVDPALTEGLLLEPAARNTAAAIGHAALHIAAQHGGKRVLYVCPSDHLIRQPKVLQQAVAAALPAVRAGLLATFGIHPQRPEPGFGYIRAGAPLADNPSVRWVLEFVEKPPVERARAMVESGYLWNSGMFLFRADRFLEELEICAPEVLQPLREAFLLKPAQASQGAFAAAYHRIPAEPIDRAVMERSRAVVVVPCDPGWSDLGSWQALWELGERDAHGNLLAGDVEAENAEGCLVHGDSRLIALAGVADLVIVDTPDALLVGRRGDSEALKRLVGRLAAASRPEATEAPLRLQPSARERLVARSDGYEVWELVLAHRAPWVPLRRDATPVLWTVVEGEVELATSGRTFRAGDALPSDAEGPLRNPADRPARLVGVRLLRPPATTHI